MEQRVREFLAGKTIALLGATDKREKWGYKIFRHLVALGYEVLPVNPGVAAIEGHKAYATLRDLPVRPDGVSLVVPPSITEQAVRLAHELWLPRVWMQPGAESDDAIEFCDAHGLECVHHKCILVETNG
jgi:predicted CoA-binding protein